MNAKDALSTVYSAHQNRVTMSDRFRKMGAPQTWEQKLFVMCFSPEGEKIVNFYAPKGKYGCLSNFVMGYPFELKGQEWASVEHWYQSMKYVDPEDTPEQSKINAELVEHIRDTNTGNKAFMLGRQTLTGGYSNTWHKSASKSSPLLKDIIAEYKGKVKISGKWNECRDDIMRQGVHAKFTQNPKLMKILKKTFPCKIQEASPRDSYWGIGKDLKGKNKMGELLEEIRSST
jgi:predicted NAD-dependent protein-ADP-ribosyltransferase YbiA (DUF1768 family)